MKISAVKEVLTQVSSTTFNLPTGKKVPAHFHITEVGLVNKKFIDCGGTLREESVISFQLWENIDFHHRLVPAKFLKIIEMAEQQLGLEDLEVEVEYQAGTIGKFGLDFENDEFILTNKQTACLALEDCGIPLAKTATKVVSQIKNLASDNSCCTPGGGCC